MMKQAPMAQGDVFKSLALYEQQSKTPKYSIYNEIKQIRVANRHILEAGNG